MRPLIGITLGDPAGLGPAITVKALADHPVSEKCRPLVIGDVRVLKNAAQIVGRRSIRINGIENPSEGEYRPGCIDVIDMKNVDPETLAIGKVSAVAGEAAFQYVKKAIGLAMAGEVDATVTNALNKEALNLAGRHYSGHTEIYAEFTGTEKYTMMLAHKNLRVVHVSTHVALREACDRVKKDRIIAVSYTPLRAHETMDCLEGKKSKRLFRLLRKRERKASIQRARYRPTPYFQKPGGAGTMW